jgi:hypothetical protein
VSELVSACLDFEAFLFDFFEKVLFNVYLSIAMVMVVMMMMVVMVVVVM